jgi:hypothetical protein
MMDQWSTYHVLRIDTDTFSSESRGPWAGLVHALAHKRVQDSEESEAPGALFVSVGVRQGGGALTWAAPDSGWPRSHP